MLVSQPHYMYVHVTKQGGRKVGGARMRAFLPYYVALPKMHCYRIEAIVDYKAPL